MCERISCECWPKLHLQTVIFCLIFSLKISDINQISISDINQAIDITTTLNYLHGRAGDNVRIKAAMDFALVNRLHMEKLTLLLLFSNCIFRPYQYFYSVSSVEIHALIKGAHSALSLFYPSFLTDF